MPAQTDTLSRIYAQSLFDLCNEAGGRDKIMEVADELEQVCELVRADQGFREYLDSPVIESSRRGLGVRTIFENRVTDLLLRFLLVLNTNDRLGKIESIQSSFDDLVQDAWGRIEVDVWTSSPLDDASRERRSTRLHQILNKEPVLHCWTDENLIGGVRIRIGDQLIDGSVAARLKQFEKSLQAKGSHVISAEPNSFMTVPNDEGQLQ